MATAESAHFDGYDVIEGLCMRMLVLGRTCRCLRTCADVSKRRGLAGRLWASGLAPRPIGLRPAARGCVLGVRDLHGHGCRHVN